MGQIKLAAIEPKWLLQLNELQTQSTDESFTERGAQHNKRSQKDTDEDDEFARIEREAELRKGQP